MKQKKLIYDEQKAREIFNKFALRNDEFVPLTKEVLKYLPATYDGCYLITWNHNSNNEDSKMVTYFNINEYGFFVRGLGFCSKHGTFEVIAEQLKLAHNIRNDKSVLGTLKK